MRDCEHFEPLIQLYLDGLLESSEESALAEHLEHCPACAALCEDFRIMRSHLSSLEEPLPKGLHAAIMSHVQANAPTIQKKLPFPKRPLWKMLAGVAACALAALVALRFSPLWKSKQAMNLAAGASREGSELFQTAGNFDGGDSLREDQLANALYAAPSETSGSVEKKRSLLQSPDSAPSSAPLAECTDDGLYGVAVLDLDGVQKWYLGVGERENLPDWIRQEDALREDTVNGDTVDYAEIDWQEAPLWVQSLEEAGFRVVELSDRSTQEDGATVVMVFDWNE